MSYIIAFIIVLGVLIFFHELGHFLAARFFGVGVEKFSLGFGPKLFSKTIGATNYRISAIPLGGFVKMVGEEPGGEIDPADLPRSFTHKKIYQKMLIVAAGPLFNFFLAVLIFFAYYLVAGTYQYDNRTIIGNVSEGEVAESQGLQEGDQVVAIDGVPVNTWKEMSEIILGCEGRSLRFTIIRDGSQLDFDISPILKQIQNIYGEEVERYMVGIEGVLENKRVGIGEAFVEGVRETYFWTELTVVSLVKLVQGRVSTETLGGPIRIAQVAGQQLRAGLDYLIFLIAVLSVNLGVINFFPIPVLDGGHLLFFAIEAVTRRPLNTRMREVAQQIGIFILVSLVIFVFYNDISQVFFS